MPQYGAYGMALEGRSHKEILAHFYTGTTLGRAGTKKLRVLLAEGRMAVSLTSPGSFSVVDGLPALEAELATLEPGLALLDPAYR